MQAINRHRPKEFDTSRKTTHGESESSGGTNEKLGV
jgi:hypothetical protein